MKTHSEQFLKRRRFLLVLPLLTLPFITLTFWSMGGGKTADASIVQEQQGLNKELPSAQLSDGALDKMSMYNQADKDSLALREQSPSAYYPPDDTAEPGEGTPITGYGASAGYTGGMKTYADPNESKVKERLASLERTLNQPQQPAMSSYENAGYLEQASMKADLDRLERMMQAMSTGKGGDPEMQQLDGMLEKIMDIQNPGRAQEKLKQLSRQNNGRVYAVSKSVPQSRTALISDPANERSSLSERGKNNFTGLETRNRFFDINDNAPQETDLGAAIQAVIHQTQTLVSGQSVKMRLVDDIYVNGVLIPAGNFIYGKASLNGERLKLEIDHVQYKNRLFPVAMSVYAMDGIEGIQIESSLTRDAAKDGADRALQNVQLMTLDPSLAAQAAGTGVEIAKGLFSKKAKLIRVTVKAGHPVLLLDHKAEQENN